MPRQPRIPLDVGVFHIMTRGNNKLAVFHERDDYQSYLRLLLDYKIKYSVLLYHYVLMPNHVHLLIETLASHSLSKFMHGLNLSYAQYHRRKYGGVGHFWQDRFKSALVEKDRYLLACGRYIELNPLRGNLVKVSEDYPWTSYRSYAYGEKTPLINFNPLYETLGPSPAERQQIYRNLFNEVSESSTKGLFFGSTEFIEEQEHTFGIRNLPRKRGRPRKNTDTKK